MELAGVLEAAGAVGGGDSDVDRGRGEAVEAALGRSWLAALGDKLEATGCALGTEAGGKTAAALARQDFSRNKRTLLARWPMAPHWPLLRDSEKLALNHLSAALRQLLPLGTELDRDEGAPKWAVHMLRGARAMCWSWEQPAEELIASMDVGDELDPPALPTEPSPATLLHALLEEARAVHLLPPPGDLWQLPPHLVRACARFACTYGALASQCAEDTLRARGLVRCPATRMRLLDGLLAEELVGTPAAARVMWRTLCLVELLPLGAGARGGEAGAARAAGAAARGELRNALLAMPPPGMEVVPVISFPDNAPRVVGNALELLMGELPWPNPLLTAARALELGRGLGLFARKLGFSGGTTYVDVVETLVIQARSLAARPWACWSGGDMGPLDHKELREALLPVAVAADRGDRCDREALDMLFLLHSQGTKLVQRAP